MVTIDDSISSGTERGGGERTAFYAAFAPVMRAYAVRRGCDEPDDAVQDVFVKFVAAVRAGRFKAHSAAETVSYMKMQVARQVIDYHRRAKARCRDAMVEFDEFAIPLPADALRIVEAREEASIRVRAREKASRPASCASSAIAASRGRRKPRRRCNAVRRIAFRRMTRRGVAKALRLRLRECGIDWSGSSGSLISCRTSVRIRLPQPIRM